MQRLFARALAALAVTSMCSGLAQARIITHEFEVAWVDGLLSGTTSSGHFSFDTDRIPATQYGTPQEVLVDFRFDLSGVRYALDDLDDGLLTFSNGSLHRFSLGFYRDCDGLCGSFDYLPHWAMVFGPFRSDAWALDPGVAPDAPNPSYSTGVVTVTLAVPEPQTWALMLGGLAAVGWTAQRKRASRG